MKYPILIGMDRAVPMLPSIIKSSTECMPASLAATMDSDLQVNPANGGSPAMDRAAIKKQMHNRGIFSPDRLVG